MTHEHLLKVLTNFSERIAALEDACVGLRNAWAEQIESNRRLTEAHKKSVERLERVIEEAESDRASEAWRESLNMDDDE